MGRFQILLTCISLLLGSAVKAGPQEPVSKADKYSAYFYKTAPSAELVKKIAVSSAGAVCTAGACVAKNIGSETQAFFLMATLAAVEGVKQHYEYAGIKKEQVSLEDLAKTSRMTAEHVLKASEIWAGTFGMLAGNAAMRIPVQTWNSVLMNASARFMVRELLVGATANLIGFIGFDAASELMTRAVQMIPSEEDRQKASQLAPTFWESLTSKDAKLAEEDRRIVVMVFSKMYEILIKNGELREKWWSFSVRNRYQTGNFVVGVTVMSMGATAGAQVGTFIPNPAGKLVTLGLGIAVGIGSGLVVSAVPSQYKDEITEMFQSSRISSSRAKIESEQVLLREELKHLESEMQKRPSLDLAKKWNLWNIQRYQERIVQDLGYLDSDREALMTSFYDRIHFLNSKMYALENHIQIARAYRNTEAERAFQQELNAYLKAYRQSAIEIDKQLASEESYFQTLAPQISLKAYADQIKSQAEGIRVLRRWTYQYLKQIMTTAIWFPKANADEPESLMSEQENQRLLEKIYMWGFKKEPFVETMEFNN